MPRTACGMSVKSPLDFHCRNLSSYQICSNLQLFQQFAHLLHGEFGRIGKNIYSHVVHRMSPYYSEFVGRWRFMHGELKRRTPWYLSICPARLGDTPRKMDGYRDSHVVIIFAAIDAFGKSQESATPVAFGFLDLQGAGLPPCEMVSD